MLRFPLALLLVAPLATACSPARAAFSPAFDYGTLNVSRSSASEPLTASYSQGSLLVSGGDLRLGTGTFASAAAKFFVGPGPITSAFLTIDVVLTQGTAGFGGSIPLLISGLSTDSNPIGLADFLEPATAGPTLSLPSNLGNDGRFDHFYSVDVTSLVRGLVSTGGSNIELRFTNSASNSNILIAPSFGVGVANRPALTINEPLASVPEPASAALAMVGLGLAGAGYAARRRPARGVAPSPRAG